MADKPNTHLGVHEAIVKELRRQADQHLGYFSTSDETGTEGPYASTIDGSIDLGELARVATKAVLDEQAKLLPALACSASKLEYVKAALRVFYTLMVPNVRDPIATMVDRSYATDRLGELEG